MLVRRMDGTGILAARCAGTAPGQALRWLASALFACLVLLVAGFNPALAVEKAEVDLKLEDNYGRIVITFRERNLLPSYKVNADNGVLVVTFDQPVEMKVDRVPSVLSRYVTIARSDPDGRGARFALTRATKVNTMEAGAKLFLDFMPTDWDGPPPQLPPEVIADLAKRAEEAAKIAREAELLRIAGSKSARLDVRVARAPTFSRFVFKWNIPFEADFSRDGSAVSVAFNRVAQVDLSAIKASLPPFLDDINSEPRDNGIAVVLSVSPSADVRAFREDGTYVVDVQGTTDPATLPPAEAAIQKAIGTQHDVPHDATEEVHAVGAEPPPTEAETRMAVETTTADPAHDGTESHDAAPKAPAAQQVAMADPAASHGADHAAAPAADHSADHAETPAADQAAVPAASHGADHAAPAEHGHEHDADVAPEPSAVPVIEEAIAPVMAEVPVEPAAAEVAVAELPDGANDRVIADDAIRVEAKRIGESTRIVFPYGKEIGSAMFSRGPALWLVFDDPSPIDAGPLQDALAGLARSIEPMKVDDSQAIRIELSEPMLSTLNPDGTFWVVTIGDMVMQPTRPLPVKRAIHDDGTASLDVPFGPVSEIHRIKDPSTGDEVVVVTGKGQPRGLIKPQHFAEVEGLSSAHGLAFVPMVDDLEIRAKNELVTLDRPGGMAVSTALPSKSAAILDVPGAIGASLGGRTGFVNFTGLEAKTVPEFWTKRHQMSDEVAQSREKTERVDKWYKTAAFMLANGLGPETVGVLNLIQAIAPEESTSEKMAMIRAGGSVLMNRPRDVLATIDRPELAESGDAAVWRTIALADLGNFLEARRSLARGEGVIGSFPSVIQKRFLLAGVAVAIELNDYGKARSLLSQVDPRTLNESELAQLDMLNARAVDANGHAADAIDLLSKVVRTENGPIGAEATYRLVKLQRREGLITLDQAIDRLEQLAVAWRGDQIELNTLRTLGQLSIEKSNYRRGFEVMRIAEMIGPEAPTTRLMQEEMQAAFASLFLDGKADEMKPVDALALYYDFRELTPPGRRGDAMVRKLANRLVDVDLLGQAQQLLTYQVENRLRGGARAQVAADLALIQILDKRPDRALLTLSRTRQAELPVAIERQRRTVEARALADTGKPELALDLLRPIAGADIDRLRSDILWSSKRYSEAGDEFERLLGNRWSDEAPLSDQEQVEVLKAGISFSLAQDRLGTDRLRAKFASAMARTSSGPAFDAVTGPIVANGSNFNEVVRSVAGLETMDAFLADYRKRYLEIGGEKPVMVDPGNEPAAQDAPTPGAETQAALPAAPAG